MSTPARTPTSDGGEAGSQPTVGDDAAREVSTAQASRRFPDFFIVGHPKSGTTALSLMLMRHPQMLMPVKEPRFFSPDLRSRFRLPASRARADTLDGYLSIFAGASPEQRIGDASTAYLKSAVAASRIAAVKPDARIIAVLREPASFLRSFHLQLLHNYVESEKDFQRAIELEGARRSGKHIPRLSQSPQTLLYSDHVRYVEHLRRYYAVFPPEQVMVLIYDDFRKDNAATVRKVLRFLDVDDTIDVTPINTKPLPAVRSNVLHQLTRVFNLAQQDLSKRNLLKRPGVESEAAPRPKRSGAFRSRWQRLVYTDPTPPDAAFMLELKRRYKPEVVALSEYLDRDLVTLWGYDKID
jgi:hypothetical protein